MTCNGLNWIASNSSCELLTWSVSYQVLPAAPILRARYLSRTIPHTDDPFNATVAYSLQVPTGGVKLRPGCLFHQAFEANAVYLSQFPVDDLLLYFRLRANQSNPPGQNWGWDNHGPDQPYGLRGSIAGLFMMGAGGYLRWHNESILWGKLVGVVEGIASCQVTQALASSVSHRDHRRKMAT